MNWKRILLVVGIVIILAGGIYFAYTRFFAAQPADAEPTAAAQTTDTSTAVEPSLGVVSAEGQIVPLRDASLSFQTGGEVVEIIADEGSVLSAGDPILRLDDADQAIALANAQAALEIAQANKQSAEAGLQAAQTGAQAADVGLKAAQVSLALVTAEPTEAQILLSQSAVDLAQAGVGQASAGLGVVLQGAASSTIQAAEAQLQAAQAQLLPVRDALDALKRSNSDDEDALAQAQLNYNAAVARVNAAQAAVDEARAGATSGQRQSASGNVASASAQQEAAQAQLDKLLAGPRPEEVTVAQAGVAQAQAAVAEAALAVQKAQAAVTQAEAGVTQAEAAVASAEEDLGRMTMTAPFDGVVAKIALVPGEVAGSGVPVVTFADFNGWRVKTTDLTELDVVDLQEGDPVEIQVDAIPGETLTGTVTDIATNSQLSRGDVTYEVTIDLDAAPDLPLRWGMTVFVNVDVE